MAGEKGSESCQKLVLPLVLPEDGTYDALGRPRSGEGKNKAVAFAGHISIQVRTYTVGLALHVVQVRSSMDRPLRRALEHCGRFEL